MTLQQSKFEVWIDGEIRDGQGRLLKKLRPKRARSYVLQFLDLLNIIIGYATLTITDTGGVGRSQAPYAALMRVDAGAAITTYGILVGTGTNPVALADYALQTQVTTNVAHSSVTIAAPTTDGTTRLFEITRTFTNNTGATLNITEVGLAGMGGSSNYKYMIDRTLYSVTVNSGASVSLRYRIKITV